MLDVRHEAVKCLRCLVLHRGNIETRHRFKSCSEGFTFLSFFVWTVKLQTVPDIKRCKSAFCSRRGAGHGAEMGLLNS